MDVSILDWMSKNRHESVSHVTALNELIQETLLLMRGGRAGNNPTTQYRKFRVLNSAQ
jgi:hypothetical protein